MGVVIANRRVATTDASVHVRVVVKEAAEVARMGDGHCPLQHQFDVRASDNVVEIQRLRKINATGEVGKRIFPASPGGQWGRSRSGSRVSLRAPDVVKLMAV